MRKSTLTWAGTLGAAILMATQVQAQQATTAPEATPPADTGTDIVVTALHRETSAQSTPLSIAALSAETLARTGATQLNDFFRQVPGMNVTAGQGGANRISIRGINAAGEATVGVYYDEMPTFGPSGTTQDSGSYAADLNLFDVKRVEVLRGPQGTLYGASSMAGTLRVILNKPDVSKFEAATEDQVSATKGGSTGYFVKGMVNTPIIKDKLAVRLVGYYEERPGWIDNTFYNTQNVNRQSNWGVRGMIGWQVDDKTKINTTLVYQKQSAADMQGWFPSVGLYKTNAQVQLPFNTETQLYNATGERKLGFATLTLTGGWYKYAFNRSADFTPTAQVATTSASSCKAYYSQTAACSTAQMAGWTAYANTLLPVIAYQPAYVRAQNYEARLASNESSPDWLDWTVGAYYSNRYDTIISQNVSVNPKDGSLYNPIHIISSRYVETWERQAAGFGETTLKPTDRLSITGGLRYYDYSKTTGGRVTVGSPLFVTVPTAYSLQTTNANGWLEKAVVDYKVAPHIMVYGSASKGFRPGGANNVPGLPGNLIAYGADSLWNYELGAKTGWFDNHLTLNASFYDIEWSNMQTSARTADGLYSFITNAGHARIKGTEVELSARPMRGLTLSGGFSYTDAHLTQDQSSAAVLITTSTGRAGDLLPNVPDWMGNGALDYSWGLSNGMTASLHADAAYSGRMQSTFRVTDPYFTQYGNFTTVGLRAGVERGPWNVSIFCQNLFNATGNTSVASGSGYANLTYGIQPRTVGLNLKLAMK